MLRFLDVHGGCASTEWDALPRAELASKVRQLERVRAELAAAFPRMRAIRPLTLSANGDQSELFANAERLLQDLAHQAAATSNLSRESNLILTQAAMPSARAYVSSPSMANGTEAVNALINLMNDLRAALGDRASGNAFADLVFRRAYCHGPPIRYVPHRVEELVDQRRAFQFPGRIAGAFSSANPQPLILMLCSEVFYSPLKQVESYRSCRAHSVLITGQAYDQRTKSCAYEILNSWGDSAGKYHPSYSIGPRFGTVWLPYFQLG